MNYYLERDDGKVQYNASFVIGEEAAQKLKLGKLYTIKELMSLAGRLTFLSDYKQSIKRKWRVVE